MPMANYEHQVGIRINTSLSLFSKAAFCTLGAFTSRAPVQVDRN